MIVSSASDYRPVMSPRGALRNWREAAQFPESNDKLSHQSQRRRE
jgi:hypothetical protein